MEKTTKREPKKDNEVLRKLSLLVRLGEPFAWTDSEPDPGESGGGDQ